MSIYFMFGKYTSESVKKISRERTEQVVNLVKEFGGEVIDMYAILGAYDLILIVKFPDMKEALQASVSITKATGISFSTLPALPVEEFDELMGKVR